MGEFETLNFTIGVIPEDIALFHNLYRTSIKGRKELVESMFSDNGIMEMSNEYTSRVSEIFNVILKSLGIEVRFEDEDNEIKILNRNNISPHVLNGTTYLCSDYQFYIIERMSRIREAVLMENPVLTTDELNKKINEVLESSHFLNGDYKEDISNIPINIEAEKKTIFEKIQERKMKEESAEIAETLEKVTNEVNINDV